MDDNEWDLFFASQAASNFSTLAAPEEINAAMDGYTATDTDTEGRISPAPSVYSMTSSLRDQSFRYAHGRVLNAHGDVYYFPVDKEEVYRLYEQHRMFYFLARSDHYYGLTKRVEDALTPTTERLRRVLDLGCGPGAWTLQCAVDFPHADVLGVDLAPTCPIVPPPNCRFEIDDLNLGLDHFVGPTFDVIHARLLNSGVKDYAGLLDQLSHCLRPGGLVIFAETDFRVWTEDKRVLIPPNFYTPLPKQGGPSLRINGPSGGGSGSTTARSEKVSTVLTKWAVPAWVATMSKCMRAKGANIDAAMLLKIWMREHPNYVDVEAVDLWCPLGPWKGHLSDDWTAHPNHNIVSHMSRDLFFGLMRGARPMFYEWFSEAEVEEMECKAARDLESAENQMYLRVQVTSAHKKM